MIKGKKWEEKKVKSLGLAALFYSKKKEVLWGQRIRVPRSISNIKPKGPSRGEKRSMMTKEGPKLLREITEDRHVLGELVSWKERTIHHPQQPSPSFPNEGTSVGGQLWEHGERAIVKEFVTSALNARSWQSGRINEGMTPEQCHPVYYNS